MRFRLLHTETPFKVKLPREADLPADAYNLARKFEEAGAHNIEIEDTQSNPRTKLNWHDFARAHGL